MVIFNEYLNKTKHLGGPHFPQSDAPLSPYVHVGIEIKLVFSYIPEYQIKDELVGAIHFYFPDLLACGAILNTTFSKCYK